MTEDKGEDNQREKGGKMAGEAVSRAFERVAGDRALKPGGAWKRRRLRLAGKGTKTGTWSKNQWK